MSLSALARRIAVTALAVSPVMAAAPAGAVVPPETAPADARYVTFVIGRGLYGEGENCKLAPGAVSTMQVAADAHLLGIPMSANLIPGRYRAGATSPNGHLCIGRHLYLNTAEARTLTETYGWQHATSGLTYRYLLPLTRDEQVTEVCGALDAMRADGFTRSNAVMAAPYPSGGEALNDEILTNVIKPCGFIFGRDYGSKTFPYHPKRADGTRVRTNVRGNLHPLGYYRTVSINGGSCPSTWRCGDGGTTAKYNTPGQFLRDLIDAPRNSHYMLQVYRLVKGDVAGKWTCSGQADTHRTYTVETYCYVDFLRILKGIPADYVATDALTVAEAWGLAPTP